MLRITCIFLLSLPTHNYIFKYTNMYTSSYKLESELESCTDILVVMTNGTYVKVFTGSLAMLNLRNQIQSLRCQISLMAQWNLQLVHF